MTLPYDDLWITVEIAIGKTLQAGVAQMILLRKIMGINVRTEFNGVQIRVFRDDQTVDSIYKEYIEELTGGVKV